MAGAFGPVPVGNAGSPRRALVSPAGAVTLPSGWRVGWAVADDHRWHEPDREAAVRSRLVGNAPVVETALRIAGGDAVQRVYCVPALAGPHRGAGELLIIEIENASPAPIAVALRASDRAGRSVPATLSGTAATFGRSTEFGRSGFGRSGFGRSATLVVDSRPFLVDGAVQFPLAHRAKARIGMAMQPSDAGALDGLPLAAVASSEAVARGWDAHLRRAARLELPPGRVADMVGAALASAVLLASAETTRGAVAARVSAALDRFGLGIEAAEAAARVGVRRSFLGRHGHPAVSADLWTRLQELAGAASPLNTWPATMGSHGAIVSEVLSTAAALAVDDGPDGIRLFPGWPADWGGIAVEFSGLHTRHGVVSAALRWHGDRPALLWEVEPASGPARSVAAPALDPSWSSVERRGEALLAAGGPRPAGPPSTLHEADTRPSR